MFGALQGWDKGGGFILGAFLSTPAGPASQLLNVPVREGKG